MVEELKGMLREYKQSYKIKKDLYNRMRRAEDKLIDRSNLSNEKLEMLLDHRYGILIELAREEGRIEVIECVATSFRGVKEEDDEFFDDEEFFDDDREEMRERKRF